MTKWEKCTFVSMDGMTKKQYEDIRSKIKNDGYIMYEGPLYSQSFYNCVGVDFGGNLVHHEESYVKQKGYKLISLEDAMNILYNTTNNRNIDADYFRSKQKNKELEKYVDDLLLSLEDDLVEKGCATVPANKDFTRDIRQIVYNRGFRIQNHQIVYNRGFRIQNHNTRFIIIL